MKQIVGFAQHINTYQFNSNPAILVQSLVRTKVFFQNRDVFVNSDHICPHGGYVSGYRDYMLDAP